MEPERRGDATMTDSGGPAADDEVRRAKRQERLQQLRTVRGPSRGAAARAVAGGGGLAAAQGGAGAGLGAGPGSEQRRKALGRMARILTDTPADGTGVVPGTPFTQAGVAALLDTLGKRARNQGAPGAKMASRLLTFLRADQGEAEGDVHGVSVQKLQRLAKFAGGGKGRRRIQS
jgi:hypothetical protein